MKIIVTTQQILSYLNYLGPIVTKKYNKDKEDIKTLVIYDLMRKMQSNVCVIDRIKHETILQVSRNIIYRSIFNDLMYAIFILSLENKEDLDKVIKCIDTTHAQSVKEIYSIEHYMVNSFNKRHGLPLEDENVVYNELSKYWGEYIKSYSNRIIQMKSKTVDLSVIPRFNGHLKQIAEYFRDNNYWEPFYTLFKYYKILSQSEHYSHIGRGFNYHNEKSDIEWEKEYNVVIIRSIDVIRIWLNIPNTDSIVNQYYSLFQQNEQAQI